MRPAVVLRRHGEGDAGWPGNHGPDQPGTADRSLSRDTKRMDKDPRFIPITGTRPEDLIKGPMIRRLCICRFQCPLCMKDHEAHLYISFSAADLDEYVAKLREFASDWAAIEPTVTRGDRPVPPPGRGPPSTDPESRTGGPAPHHPSLVRTHRREQLHLRPLLPDLRHRIRTPRTHGPAPVTTAQVSRKACRKQFAAASQDPPRHQGRNTSPTQT